MKPIMINNKMMRNLNAKKKIICETKKEKEKEKKEEVGIQNECHRVVA